ncbi:MAG: DUF2116 family Zn-ribbon domain-containing protein [Clostridia bacterium]|nr:DUF2116 family Zn-ribbon domain-containing protein [Clostridia bacterium]
MKKCHYCAKEIDYSEMYCSSQCEEKASNYYKVRHNWRILVNALYIASFALVFLGLIFSPTMFSFWGLLGVSVGCIMGGLITILVPSPTEDMIKKHKMVKAQNNFRICGAVIVAVGIAALVLALIKLFA